MNSPYPPVNEYKQGVFRMSGANNPKGLERRQDPGLLAVDPVVGAEDHAPIRRDETGGERAPGPGLDVRDHRGAGVRAIAPPQLAPVLAVVGGEEDLASAVDETGWQRAPRPRVDVGHH